MNAGNPITIELPDLKDGTAAVLTINPGDTLVLSCPAHLTFDAMERIKESVEYRVSNAWCSLTGWKLEGVAHP